MWAQGLTIGLLIVAGALTHSRRAAYAKESQSDHSWKDVVSNLDIQLYVCLLTYPLQLDQQERDRQHEAALLDASRSRAAVAA